MALILHAANNNKNALKVLIAAEYNGIKLELAKNFNMGVSNKTPEFLQMNPLGKVPFLETPDGPIFESNAIACYVTRLKGDNFLHGSSLIEYGCIEQWIDFASMEIDLNIFRWLLPRIGHMVHLPPAEEACIATLKRALSALNTHLAANKYLVGHSVTLSDIIMTSNLYLGFSYLMTRSFTMEFPHVERYFWTMVNQPNFLKVMGEVKQAESVIPIRSAKKLAPSKEAVQKDESKEETKKEAKKEVAKPKVEDVEDVEEEEEAPKPKLKNSLDLLPPSKMILDEWKRLYSNTKTNFREVAIKGFWDMYDPEGYSLWFCNYKYTDENTLSKIPNLCQLELKRNHDTNHLFRDFDHGTRVGHRLQIRKFEFDLFFTFFADFYFGGRDTISFVTLNKVSGFLQRMDLARKYEFGKMLVIGSESPDKVKGLWLFRGKEIPPSVLDECYDMELYERLKVDTSDEAQKERVNAMIGDQEPFEGEALLDAKCFK
ncbi:hypothetical protein AAC387_Pa07g1302 [Persea americana]